MHAPNEPFDIEAIIPTLESVFRKIVHDLLPRRSEHLTHDDAVQLMRIAFWKASARYDSSRSSVTTFAYVVGRNALIDHLRVAANTRRHLTLRYDRAIETHDSKDDHAIEELAEQIVEDPSKFLARRQAKILAALQEYGTPARARKALGISPDAFRSALKRCRRRVAEIAIA